MERSEQDNNALQTSLDDLSKSEQHDPTQPKLSVYLWRFYGDVKTLKRGFQTSFYFKYPWFEYSIKEDAPFCFCCCFWGKRKVYIFSIVLRD